MAFSLFYMYNSPALLSSYESDSF